MLIRVFMIVHAQDGAIVASAPRDRNIVSAIPNMAIILYMYIRALNERGWVIRVLFCIIFHTHS